MPAHESAQPSYRHYKPKDLAVVRIAGKDIYLGKYNSPESWEKYGRVIAEWRATGAAPPPAQAPATSPDDGPSVSEIILLFYRHAKSYYRRPDGTPTGEHVNFKHSLRPLKALYGSTPAKDFGPKRLKLVRQKMIDDGLSRRVINQRIGRVVRVFAHAVENELIPGTVLYALKAVKGLAKGRTAARETEPVKPVDDALVDAVKPYLSRQLQAVVELQRLTGMRPGEALSMRTVDVDTSGPVWIYTPSKHKGEHHDLERRIFLGPRAQEVLRPWLRPVAEDYLFQPREAEAERHARQRRERKTRVQPSQAARKPKSRPKRTAGDRYSVRTYAHGIRYACRAAFPHPVLAEMKRQAKTRAEHAAVREWQKEHRKELSDWHRQFHWHPHQLRHAAATRLRKTYGLDIARAILGHASFAVTETYAELDTEKAVTVMAAIG